MDALGDPVRRRLVELVAAGGRPAGELARAVGDEFGISQPATSRHLRILREAGLVASEARGPVRLYTVVPGALDAVDGWVHDVRARWGQALDALGTEVARGRRDVTDDARTTRETT
ncbi:winged helix-turn-helix domain-containing protein [Cellulomonas sp. DKR-3]|uniref:Winged helix-turn-helix domain-containing protein n=2 Tax=Cellulomonas fulva TaxID=2835530 RepID=A0ABS5U371_9CELL|nr:winged helix-turn-helix domain-containing protein [Cellulomonas fulva]